MPLLHSKIVMFSCQHSNSSSVLDLLKSDRQVITEGQEQCTLKTTSANSSALVRVIYAVSAAACCDMQDALRMTGDCKCHRAKNLYSGSGSGPATKSGQWSRRQCQALLLRRDSACHAFTADANASLLHYTTLHYTTLHHIALHWQAVLELQEQLPNARVVYCSATGASEPRNLGYMSRLGLWGAGSPFPDGFKSLLDAVDSKGVGAMELLA
eukprot:19213-Heterococcus_DN1.PRE.1